MKLSKIFCKHNYSIFFADTLELIEKKENKDGIRIKHKIKAGCCICCTKCGKEKKRLAKKIGRYYANTLSCNYIQRLEKELEAEKRQLHIHKIEINGRKKNECSSSKGR